MADKDTKKDKKDKEKEKDDKKKVEKEKEEEAEVESSEEEEDEGVKVTRVGSIEVQGKKKWTAMYCVLIGGSFYWYKNAADSEPKGKVTLKEVEVVSPVPDVDDKKKSTFALMKGKEALLIANCGNAYDLGEWVKAIKGNLTLESAPPPSSSGKKRAGVVERFKKKSASATATSALGKKVMKAILNEETTALLNALKRIVKTQSNSQKKADDLEKNIIKIAVKALLLVENKKLQADDFLVADKPLREAFELLVKVFNGRKRVKPEKIEEALKKVESLLKQAEAVITNLLAPHLTPKNMLLIAQAFGVIADKDFLTDAFRRDELEEDLDKLVDAMEYYTQFHYH